MISKRKWGDKNPNYGSALISDTNGQNQLNSEFNKIRIKMENDVSFNKIGMWEPL